MARPSKHDGVVYQRSGTKFWWMRYRDRQGERRQEPTGTPDWHDAQQKLRERLQARDQNILAVVRKGEKLTFDQWADFFLENYSKPPMRAQKTHEANVNALKHLRSSLGSLTLSEINADHIENYLRSRLKQRTRVRRRTGFFDLGPLKATTVHQEFRVVKRILNVAMKKKIVSSNPCAGVEFPVTVKGLFRPHYMSWSEQQRIEVHASAV